MEKSKKKVLVLPSYWPTKNAPIVGSQVQEQTLLLSDVFEYKVFYCQSGLGLKRFIWFTIVKILTGKQLYRYCTANFNERQLDVSGIYYYNATWLPHELNKWLELNAYKSLLNRAISSGWKPDLIHARTAEYAGVYAAKLSRLFHVPLLLTENCIFILGDITSLKKIKDYQFAIESASKVVVVSSWLKNQLLINNFKCKPVVVGNWINENVFTISSNEDERPFTVLTVGHTGFTKDWDTFFNAIQYLIFTLGIKNLKIKVAVTHVFDKESKEFIPNMIKKYKLEGFFEVLYQVPRKEMAYLYQSSDIFLSTSINETFGIATAEAMFCGVPVIATKNGGIEDIISADNGIKVDIGDFVGIADAIKSVYTNEIKFKKEIIRNSIMNKFGTAAFKERLETVYLDTLDNSNP